MGLREQDKFKSVSAFAPIVNPIQAPWGIKAFTGYLGSNSGLWAPYDACELIKSGHTHPQTILIDQGLSDTFLAKELLSENLLKAAANSTQKLQINMREGYDHSYYFISTFMQSHIEFHSQHLS